MAPYDISTRALIISLKATRKSSNKINYLTKIPTQTINLIYGRAIMRGFDPAQQPLHIKDSYLENAPRSGRPSKQVNAAKKIVYTIRTNRYRQEKSYTNTTSALN